jgi:hypothetical protein
MTQAPLNEVGKESSKKPLAKISPATVVAEAADIIDVSKDKEIKADKTIIEATRLLLR